MIPLEIIAAYCRDCQLSPQEFTQGTFYQLHKLFWRNTFLLYHVEADKRQLDVDVLINSNPAKPGGGKVVFGLVVYWAAVNRWSVRLKVHRGLSNPRAYCLYNRFGLTLTGSPKPNEVPEMIGHFAGVSPASVARIVTGHQPALFPDQLDRRHCGATRRRRRATDSFQK